MVGVTANYIEYRRGGVKLHILKSSYERLQGSLPLGCPFPGYTLADLLLDMFTGYSWRILSDMTIVEFIEMLQKVGYAHSIAYGDDILTCIYEGL